MNFVWNLSGVKKPSVKVLSPDKVALTSCSKNDDDNRHDAAGLDQRAGKGRKTGTGSV